MTCRHRAGEGALREQYREAHRAYVASGGGGLVVVLIGSAMTADDGVTPIGNFGVLEAATRADALAFAQDDPFNRVGLFEAIEITALTSRFPVDRIVPMTPRP